MTTYGGNKPPVRLVPLLIANQARLTYSLTYTLTYQPTNLLNYQPTNLPT